MDDSGSSVLTSSENSGSVSTVRDSTLIDWCSDNGGCLSTACPDAYWTSCSGNTLYSQGGSSSCSPGRCGYDLIYPGSTADSTSWRWYHCIERSYLMFYREEPTDYLFEDVSTIQTSSSESSSAESTSNTASPASGTVTIASQTSEPTKSSTPTAEPTKEKEESKAWIAGVVIGIVGPLAVAGMGFYLWRQRQQKHAYNPAPQGPPQGLMPMQPGYPPQQTAYYPPQQVPYGSGPSPIIQPVSPNMSAYDAQMCYGDTQKPQEGFTYGGYAAYGGNGAPPPDMGTVEMPGKVPVQPQMAANMHELPELAPSPGW